MNGRALYTAIQNLSENTISASKSHSGNYVTINDKNYVYNTSYAEKQPSRAKCIT